MSKGYLKLIVIALVLVMVLGISGFSFATDNLGEDVVNALQSKDAGLMGAGAMSNIQKLSRDIFNIIRYIVIAYLVIKLFGLFSQFSNAGDNPQLKASLKTRLLWTAGGLVLALNFWFLYNFIAGIVVDLSA